MATDRIDAPRFDAQSPGVARVLSIDLLRGLDVLLMLFVNELAGVRGTPAFLLHKPRDADGMTITDVVFPAFLFVIGLAVPFALSGRLRRGETIANTWRHVATRTLALLAMGVFMVNSERAAAEGILSPEVWAVLMTVGIVLVWGVPPVSRIPLAHRGLRSLGMALLLALAFLFRSTNGTGLFQMRPHWWGILGLLGWAYFVSAGLYLLARDREAVLLGCVGLLYCLYLADEVGQAGWLVAVRPYFAAGRTAASHSAVALSGVVLGVMLLRQQQTGGSRTRFAWRALGYTAGLAAAGFLLHSLHGLHSGFWINKVRATPSWCLFSSALTGAAWLGLFLLVDVKGRIRWPKAVSMAGENALMAYLVPYVLLALFAMSAPLFGGMNPYDALGQNTAAGFVRSALFAWIVVRVCGWMRAHGIRMRL